MKKSRLILLFLIVFPFVYGQTNLDISDEKGLVSIDGVKVIPYADGSFSICKYSAEIPYTSKVEYFMYHYDNDGKLTSSKKATLDGSVCPYGRDLIAENDIIFDDEQKRWIMISTKKNQTEVSEWNEDLEKVSSTKIEDLEKGYSFIKAEGSKGRFVFYKKTNDGKGFKRYEYESVTKTLKTSLYFPDLYVNIDKKANIKSQFAGKLDSVEYFIFLETKNSTSNKNEKDYILSLTSYNPYSGENKVAVEKFSLNKNISMSGPVTIKSVKSHMAENLYIEFDLSCMDKECMPADQASSNGFRLLRISKGGEMITSDLWSANDISWTGNPSLYYHGDGEDFHLIFKGSDALSTKFDMETGEKSDIVLFKSTRFVELRDLEIFFPDESSQHLLESLYAKGDKRFAGITYIEDAYGIGKLFLLSYGYYYTKLEIIMYK